MALALVRLIPTDTNIPFIKVRFAAFLVSVALILGSLGAFFTLGLNFGIDFRGGTAIEVRTEGPADLGALRSVMEGLQLGDVQVQGFGSENEALVRVGQVSAERVNELEGHAVENDAEAQQAVRQYVSDTLEREFPGITFQKIESLSPQVSGELVVAGATSIFPRGVGNPENRPPVKDGVHHARRFSAESQSTFVAPTVPAPSRQTCPISSLV